MPRRDAKDQLSAREKAFVAHFVVTDNGAEAARRAGYATRNADAAANNLRKKPLVAQAIAEAQAIVAARAAEKVEQALDSAAELSATRTLTEGYVLGKLQANVERAEQKGDVAGVNGACKLLGDYLAMWKQRVEHSGPGAGPIAHEVVVTRRIIRPEATE